MNSLIRTGRQDGDRLRAVAVSPQEASVQAADPPIHLGRRLGFRGLHESGLPLRTGRQRSGLFPHSFREVLQAICERFGLLEVTPLCHDPSFPWPTLPPPRGARESERRPRLRGWKGRGRFVRRGTPRKAVPEKQCRVYEFVPKGTGRRRKSRLEVRAAQSLPSKGERPILPHHFVAADLPDYPRRRDLRNPARHRPISLILMPRMLPRRQGPKCERNRQHQWALA